MSIAENWAVMRVAVIDKAADGIVLLTLEDPDGRLLPEWEPGAHLDVVAGEAGIRQYSLCGPLAERDYFQIAVLREPAGRGGSDWIHRQLRAGASVRVRGPRNNFQLADAPRYFFVAGGIGITPILSMIREADLRGRDWQLLYGGRSGSSMAFTMELERIDSGRGRVSLRPQDEFGQLDLPRFLGPAGRGDLIYGCGPAGLLAALSDLAAAALWDLSIERFAGPPAGPDPEAAGEMGFDVVCARSAKVVRVTAGKSILEALEESAIGVDYSCREGYCGTCETEILAGIPDHRDEVYGSWGRKPSDRMMLCVSRSLTPVIELDV